MKTEKDLSPTQRSSYLKALSALETGSHQLTTALLGPLVAAEPEFVAGRRALVCKATKYDDELIATAVSWARRAAGGPQGLPPLAAAARGMAGRSRCSACAAASDAALLPLPRAPKPPCANRRV